MCAFIMYRVNLFDIDDILRSDVNARLLRWRKNKNDSKLYIYKILTENLASYEIHCFWC